MRVSRSFGGLVVFMPDFRLAWLRLRRGAVLAGAGVPCLLNLASQGGFVGLRRVIPQVGNTAAAIQMHAADASKAVKVRLCRCEVSPRRGNS